MSTRIRFPFHNTRSDMECLDKNKVIITCSTTHDDIHSVKISSCREFIAILPNIFFVVYRNYCK